MSIRNLVLAVLFVLPNLIFSQEGTFSSLKTNTGEVKIPGKWQQLNTMNDSGQTYLKNDSGVIIAIAQNPKKAYPFYQKNDSDFKSVTAFYKWDTDYIGKSHPVTQLKENAKSEYIIWKYNDGKADNVFLFGSVKANFLNLLVYTNSWEEAQKIQFLEELYLLNK
ncbi:hypothetical protein [Flavobacterium sp. GCM10027622]|uniref:hypothetical protein n=1 Tax=unclassified Flavobacterium TaxID=196869 RepID=UPI003609D64C